MRIVFAAAWMLVFAPVPALADAASDEHQMCMHEMSCRAASSDELDELRGGFDVRIDGRLVRLDIGITRMVSVNDRVVAVSSLVPPQHVSQTHNRVNNLPGAAEAPLQVTGQPLIVQNGPANANVAPPVSAFAPGAMPIIIQNTLDNQKLTTFTVIDAAVNSLTSLRMLRMSEMLSRATAGSARP